MSAQAQEIMSTVRKFVQKNFLLNGDSILRPDDSLLESGVVDSTGILELISFLEETYGIRFEDQELVADNFDSLTRLTRTVQNKLAGTG